MDAGLTRGADKLGPAWLERLLVPGTRHPNDARTIRQGAREQALRKLVRLRLVVAPALGCVALTFAFFEPTTWRRALIGTVVTAMTILTFAEWARFRRFGPEALGIAFNLGVMLAGQLGLIAATGGLFSPLVPVVVVAGTLSAILLEPRTQVLFVLTLTVPAFWAMAFVHAGGEVSLVPRLFGDAAGLERGPAPWIAATLYTVMVTATSRVGVEVRLLFERLVADSMRERDRVLDLHAEQSRTLAAVSAEIAHELKNPLASVKGLGALVAKGVDGKTAERVGVLRREVDRMQAILEELLTFSRPLVPLSTEAVDARDLMEDVLRLHEGLAQERGVRLTLDAGPAAVLRCDPRKVRQVLINLVQNALDASPRGAVVHLAVAGDADDVRLSVIDAGAGVSPELGERVFEPGVTSKEHGSGMGLAVSRALARQHGGELALDADEGGGAVATLTLPREVTEPSP